MLEGLEITIKNYNELNREEQSEYSLKFKELMSLAFTNMDDWREMEEYIFECESSLSREEHPNAYDPSLWEDYNEGNPERLRKGLAKLDEHASSNFMKTAVKKMLGFYSQFFYKPFFFTCFFLLIHLYFFSILIFEKS